MTRLLGLIGIALILFGCGPAAKSPTATPASPSRLYGPGTHLPLGKRLVPYTTLAGYLNRSGTLMSDTFKALIGADERPLFSRPVAVAASETGVYILDGATYGLWRFRWTIEDPAHQSPEHREKAHGGLTHAEFIRLRTLTELDEPTRMTIGPDGDLYIADGKGAKVVRYDPQGNRKRIYKHDEHLRYPSAVAVDRRGLRLFIADAFYNRVLVMNSEGEALYAIGNDDSRTSSGSVRDLVQSDQGLLYLLNASQKVVQVFGVDGTYVRAMGEGTFSSAGAIALDESGRVFVVDDFEQKILIYVQGRLVESVGRRGGRPGELNGPQAIWYHNKMLYVADTGNSRIQVFRVLPEEMAGEAGSMSGRREDSR